MSRIAADRDEMERPLSSALVAEAYGTFVLTFLGATAITKVTDGKLFLLGPSLGLGFIGLGAFSLLCVGSKS